MFRLLVLAGCVLAASTASAQQVMDGSDANVPPEIMAKITASIGENLLDPYGAQIDRLKPMESRTGGFCGRFNAKNNAGGYVGFRPFSYDPATGDFTSNETNECGKAVYDEAFERALMSKCQPILDDFSLLAAGQLIGRDTSILQRQHSRCLEQMKDLLKLKLDALSN